MTQLDHALSVQGLIMRMTRLDNLGKPVIDPEASYVTKAFVSVSFTPNYNEGASIQTVNASGAKCLNYKIPDTLDSVSLELSVCAPGPEITEILAGGSILTATIDQEDYNTGWASPKLGSSGREDGSSGVSLEVWSRAAEDDHDAYQLPYWHYLFPKTTLRASGSRVIEAENAVANTFEGNASGNVNFGKGPDGNWAWPAATDRPFMWGRVAEDDLPTTFDYVAVTANTP